MKIRIHDQSELDNYVTCASCTHYLYTFKMTWNEQSPLCRRRGFGTLDLVTGEVRKLDLSQLWTCAYERENSCGEKGVHWVPRKKSKENTFKLLKRDVK